MKYLSIKEGKAEFLQDMELFKYTSITEMVNTDVYNLLIWISDDTSPVFDEDLSQIKNDAERVVYENLLKKIKDFNNKKAEIKAEIDDMFKPLEEKYL